MEEGHEEDIGSSGDGCGSWRGRGDGPGARRGARHRSGPGVWSGGWRTDRGRDRSHASVLRLWLRAGLLLRSDLLCAGSLRLLRRTVSALLPPLLSSLVTDVTCEDEARSSRSGLFPCVVMTRMATVRSRRHCARW